MHVFRGNASQNCLWCDGACGCAFFPFVLCDRPFFASPARLVPTWVPEPGEREEGGRSGRWRCGVEEIRSKAGGRSSAESGFFVDQSTHRRVCLRVCVGNRDGGDWCELGSTAHKSSLSIVQHGEGGRGGEGATEHRLLLLLLCEGTTCVCAVGGIQLGTHARVQKHTHTRAMRLGC